jgi:hypothetical protein
MKGVRRSRRVEVINICHNCLSQCMCFTDQQTTTCQFKELVLDPIISGKVSVGGAKLATMMPLLLPAALLGLLSQGELTIKHGHKGRYCTIQV